MPWLLLIEEVVFVSGHLAVGEALLEHVDSGIHEAQLQVEGLLCNVQVHLPLLLLLGCLVDLGATLSVGPDGLPSIVVMP